MELPIKNLYSNTSSRIQIEEGPRPTSSRQNNAERQTESHIEIHIFIGNSILHLSLESLKRNFGK